MAKIVRLNVVTRLDLDPNTVLEDAHDKLEHVVVIGYDKEENEYFASSIAAGDTVLWLMERFKHKLMKIADEMTNDG